MTPRQLDKAINAGIHVIRLRKRPFLYRLRAHYKGWRRAGLGRWQSLREAWNLARL